jgi:hypothetical protein
MYRLYCKAPTANSRRVLIARGTEGQMILARNNDMKVRGYPSYSYRIVKDQIRYQMVTI